MRHAFHYATKTVSCATNTIPHETNSYTQQARTSTVVNKYLKHFVPPICHSEMLTLKNKGGETVGITLNQLYQIAENAELNIIETPLNDDEMGYYDDSTHTILLDNTLNDRQKKCTLAHELVHAKHHDSNHDKRTEARTIRETANWLIDPLEYATIEQLYEGNGTLMALELDITMQVLDDYQHILASRF